MRRFVGFGFGPIQAGLVLYEAQASRAFDDYVIAEVDGSLVDAVRSAGGAVTVNVAAADGIRQRRLEGIRIGDPAVPADRAMIVEAIRRADEMATAIPSVTFYAAGGPASIAAMLADGVTPDRPQVLYACENNNYAAGILRGELAKLAPAERLRGLALLDTVIGKMSGVIASPGEMRALGLAPLVAGGDRCVLVEEFNRILVSRVPPRVAGAGHRRLRGEGRPAAVRGSQALRPQRGARPARLPRRTPRDQCDERHPRRPGPARDRPPCLPR